VAMPEHHSQKHDGDWDVERYEELVHRVAEWGKGVNAEETERNQSSNT
jgi:hypothetical protein